jgi:hypothetical protein
MDEQCKYYRNGVPLACLLQYHVVTAPQKALWKAMLRALALTYKRPLAIEPRLKEDANASGRASRLQLSSPMAAAINYSPRSPDLQLMLEKIAIGS